MLFCNGLNYAKINQTEHCKHLLLCLIIVLDCNKCVYIKSLALFFVVVVVYACFMSFINPFITLPTSIPVIRFCPPHNNRWVWRVSFSSRMSEGPWMSLKSSWVIITAEIISLSTLWWKTRLSSFQRRNSVCINSFSDELADWGEMLMIQRRKKQLSY